MQPAEKKRLSELLSGWEQKALKRGDGVLRQTELRAEAEYEKCYILKKMFQNRKFTLDTFTDVACARCSCRHTQRMPAFSHLNMFGFVPFFSTDAFVCLDYHKDFG